MKKIPCLLLCLLMLFCVACQTEEVKEPVLGTQYVSGQNTYNTHVRMVLVTEEVPRDPLASITVEIQNDTDYTVNLGRFDEWQCEKWDGGKWTKLPLGVIRGNEYTDFVAQKSAQRHQKFFAEPLEKGNYRLQHIVCIQPPDGEKFECMVEVYFTVFPGVPSASS